MGKTLIPLLVVAGAAAVWCQNITRTPKLEILRSPTKVAIWKPDPYPVLTRYGDDPPAPSASTNQTDRSSAGSTAASGNQTTEGTADSRDNGTRVDGSLRNATREALNYTTTRPDLSNLSNATCIRRDYEEDVAAVFKDEVGPIEDALLVFNSTVQTSEQDGVMNNITELSGLRVLNETVVDCEAYLKDEIMIKTS